MENLPRLYKITYLYNEMVQYTIGQSIEDVITQSGISQDNIKGVELLQKYISITDESSEKMIEYINKSQIK